MQFLPCPDKTLRVVLKNRFSQELQLKFSPRRIAQWFLERTASKKSGVLVLVSSKVLGDNPSASDKQMPVIKYLIFCIAGDKKEFPLHSSFPLIS